ncbi:hypothetical protein F9802_09545 [Bacillus aerolatus]|uniref:Lipoprotein n=1 Tax=Bacillus aerolatus TaxID=2653354 RepID=A0A6I1FLX0_9BACI|nr:hypothetical protein [Bacillus aerolatus]KAB7707239.1 hypothetical protein F9802_09545 [Bacillus aerolatus]
MKKFLFFITFLTIVSCSLMGCISTNTYSGESEHWKGTFTLNHSGDQEVGEGELVYKGEDINHLKEVKWVNGSMSGEIEMEDRRIGLNSHCGGCAHQPESGEYEVTVEWNGKKETFSMKNQ